MRGAIGLLIHSMTAESFCCEQHIVFLERFFLLSLELRGTICKAENAAQVGLEAL